MLLTFGICYIDSPTEGTTPPQDNNHGDDLRTTHLGQNTVIQSVVNVKESNHKRRRCRDYDGKRNLHPLTLKLFIIEKVHTSFIIDNVKHLIDQ